MGEVIKPEPWWAHQHPSEPPEPPMDLTSRVARLELLAERADTRLHAIEKDLAVLRSETRAHIAEAKNSIILWVVAAVFLAQLLPVVAGLVKHYFP